jgi:peptidoglycan/xylan/chitin deacetylase (PgdA/CDA1 family)
LTARKVFRKALIKLTNTNESDLAAEAHLYLSSQQLRDLTAFNVEIGDHTYTHVNCRSLSANEFKEEIDQNKALLETVSGKKLRSFSVPYGSSADLTTNLLTHLRRSGYEAIFLAEGCANSSSVHGLGLDRVSAKASSNAGLFSEIEVLPRLRTIRNRLYGATRTENRRNISGLERVRPTTWPCASGQGVNTGGERN